MKALVTGANGFLGRHVVARLRERGHDVRALIRPASDGPVWGDEVEVVRLDLRSAKGLDSALAGIDAVIHLAAAVTGDEDTQFASTVVGTEHLLEAMVRSAARRLVLASSMVVYDWDRARGTITEDTPLAADIYQMGAYGIAKYWQEQTVYRGSEVHGLRQTVLRPGFLWGRGREEIAGMGRVVGRLSIMFGPGTRLPLTHVENCADCFVAVAESEATVGHVFNVVDSDDVRVWRYSREHARRTGRGEIPIPVPYWLGLAFARLAAVTSRAFFGRRGRLPSLLTPRRFEGQFKPLRFSNRRLREVLGWSPPLSFDECLARTYDPM